MWGSAGIIASFSGISDWGFVEVVARFDRQLCSFTVKLSVFLKTNPGEIKTIAIPPTPMFAKKQQYIWSSQVARHKQVCLRTAALLWFYFGCLFLNVRKDLHFHFLNVLKATVTGMLNWVSITSIALLRLSFLSVLCLWEGTNSDLQASEVLAQWWSGWQIVTGIKQMWQSRTIADRECKSDDLHREELFPLLNIIILCSTCTLKGNSPGSSFTWNLATVCNFSDSLLCFWG